MYDVEVGNDGDNYSALVIKRPSNCRTAYRSNLSRWLIVPATLLSISSAAADDRLPSPPSLIVMPESGAVFEGPEGGPFQPSSFEYRLSASKDVVRYSIRTPSWLKASSSSGSVGTDGTTVTFTLDLTTGRMQPGTYGPIIAFTNVTNGQGSTIRTARLHIRGATSAPPALRVVPAPLAAPAPAPRPMPGRSPAGPRGLLPDGAGGHLTDEQGNSLLAR
jgi:hypothetical protein